MAKLSTEDLVQFLRKLDEADVNVTDWEAKFIESNLSATHFSDKQVEAIEKMIETYGRRIGW